jgi:hypothetical protein
VVIMAGGDVVNFRALPGYLELRHALDESAY